MVRHSLVYRSQCVSVLLSFAALIALVACLVVLPHCSHPGLAGKMADGSLSGCMDWAVQHQDVELEQLCKAGRPLADVLDLFAARQQQGMTRDAGTDR